MSVSIKHSFFFSDYDISSMVDFTATLYTSSSHISRRFMQSPLWRPKFRRLPQLGPQNLHNLVFLFEFLYTLGHLILLLHPHLLCNLGKWKTEKGFFTCQGWEHFRQLLQSPYKICTVGYFTLLLIFLLSTQCAKMILRKSLVQSHRKGSKLPWIKTQHIRSFSYLMKATWM